MSDCCSAASARVNCPHCNAQCLEVPVTTMLQHLDAPWSVRLAAGPYYYCHNRDCETVYFAPQGESYRRDRLRQETRQALAAGLICFCYGIDAATANRDQAARAFVIEQTRQKHCACESRNPSGRCCLKELPA